MDSKVRKNRDAKRIQYLEEEVEILIKEKPNEFLRDLKGRLLELSNDVYGKGNPASNFIKSVLETGKPETTSFDDRLVFHKVYFINSDMSGRLARNLAFEASHIYNQSIEYFEENNLYGLWESLEQAGMSHEDIGRYFENFKQK